MIAILCVVASCYLNEDLCYHEWCWENLISAKKSVDVTEHDDLISAEYSSSGNVTLSFSSDARLTSEFLEKISNDGHLSCEVTANAECIMLNLKQKKVARPDLEPTELSLSLFRKLSHVEEGVRKNIMKDSMRILSHIDATKVDYKEGVRKRHVVTYHLRIQTGHPKTLILIRNAEKYFYQFQESLPLDKSTFIRIKMQLFY